MKAVIKAVAVFGVLALACIYAGAQDLGSSNKLFGAGSAKKKPAAKPKAAPKNPKASTARSKATSKPKAVTARTTKPPAKDTKPAPAKQTAKTAKPDAQKPKETRPEPTIPPVSAAAAALFEKLIEEGNAARDDRNYTAAETAYLRAKAIKPKDARAVYGLGNLYSDQQRWDDAENLYRSALQLDAGNPFIHVALSYVLTQPIMASNLSERYEEAEQLARRAIELAPTNALAFDQLGVAMELRGLIGRETENAYRNAIRLDPTFAPPYAHLARLLRRRGMDREAAAAYDDAVRRSTDVATMVIVADVMQSEQKFAESEPLLRRAVDDDPKNPTALLLLGRALTTMGQYPEAERILLRSIDVSHNGFMANLLLGSLYARQGQYERAENALLQALRFVSENEKRRLSQHFETVGDGYMRAGKSRNAERAYRQAQSLDGERESLTDKLDRARHS